MQGTDHIVISSFVDEVIWQSSLVKWLPSCFEIIAKIFTHMANVNVTVPESKDNDDSPPTDKKRKAPAKGRGKPAKKKAVSESDEEDDEDEDEDEEPSSAEDSDEPKAKGVCFVLHYYSKSMDFSLGGGVCSSLYVCSELMKSTSTF
jgi:hypothetical protein